MLKECLDQLIQGRELPPRQISHLLNEMLTHENQIQIAALLALLQAKGMNGIELTAMLKVLRENMIPFEVDHEVLDIVGTGGDGKQTMNISTAASLLIACCGVPVVKHGNRGVSSPVGSADFLQALGLDIDLELPQLQECFKQYHFAFCYAPRFHPLLHSMKQVRHRLQIPTCFNLLGPLLNPASASYLLLGVYDPKYLMTMAQALQFSGIKKALIYHVEGYDELIPTHPFTVLEVSSDKINHLEIDATHLGLNHYHRDDLCGGSAQENAERMIKIFQGAPDPLVDTLLLNAGCALYIYGACGTLREAIREAKKVLDSGKVFEFVEQLRKF